MSRIVITDKGRLLQSELKKEVEKDTFSLKHRDTATFDSFAADNTFANRTPKKKPIAKLFEGGILGHLTINETIKKELAPLEDEEGTNTMIMETGSGNNKFLQAKLNKLNTELLKNSPMSKKPAGTTTIFTLPQIGSSFGNMEHNISLHSRGISQGHLQGELTDRFGVDQYSKILHYESSISRLIERHIDNKKKILRTAKQVLENYDKKIRSLTDQNHKPPELLESLRADNPEAVEVLLRNTRSKFRKMKRIDNYYQQKYKPFQERYNDMMTKRFHEQHYVNKPGVE